MTTGRIRRLHFDLSDSDLDDLVRSLAQHDPFALHRRAWEAVAGERARRELVEPARDIMLWSGVFETLPWTVQRRLSHHRRPH